MSPRDWSTTFYPRKMRKGLEARDFLALQDYSSEEIHYLMKLARSFKRKEVDRGELTILEGRHIALFFQKPSTRTRVSFEVAIRELGGSSIFLSSNEAQVSRGETVADTARVLSKYVDAIVARVYSHADLIEMAGHADVPVINALSDRFHPAQILSDLFTIQEVKGRLKGLRMAYIGDGNNVCQSLLIGCSKVGVDVRVACPKGYEPDQTIVKRAQEYALSSRSSVVITENPIEACRNAHIIYTDTFASMGKEHERGLRLKTFLPKYQVTSRLFRVAAKDAFFLHCLPAHRGEEVTSSVIDGPRSLVWTQAQNRLYAQEALLAAIVG